MCPDSTIHTWMLYSFALAPCFPLVLLECLPSTHIKWQNIIKAITTKVVSLVLAVLIFSYAYSANVNYTHAYYTNRQAENYMASIVTQVRMIEGFSADQKWALIGKLNDPLLKSIWGSVPVYNSTSAVQTLVTCYSRNSWIKSYVGYNFPIASNEEIAQIQADPRFTEMPCWPDNGSIAIIDNTVVIKFSD